MSIKESLCNEFNLFINETFGYIIPAGKLGDIENKLRAAMDEQSFSDVDSYITYILENRKDENILRQLTSYFTVGETYFFREKPLFDYLPKLFSPMIQERRKTSKKIRIWSAGCSSGEEPYSLAILLHQLIPDITEWDIKIFATDINTHLLEKGRHGIYQDWSFRGVTDSIKERYFLPVNESDYEVIPEIKKLVLFQKMNLITYEYPSIMSNIYNIDFIFCRNVLMYLGEEARVKVLDAFYRTLCNEGCLFLALTELAYVVDPRYKINKIVSITYYQKKASGKSDSLFQEGKSKAEPLSEIIPSVAIRIESAIIPETGAPQISTVDRHFYKGLVENFIKKEYTSVISTLERILSEKDANNKIDEQLLDDLFILMIKSQINIGDIQKAEYWIKSALQKTILNHELYFLYASALYRVAAFDEAISLLKKTLYLEPDFISAHYLLLQAYQKTDREAEFYKTLEILKRILEPLEENITIDALGKITTGTLKNVIYSLNYSSKIPE